MVVDGSTGEVIADSAWKLIRQCADTQARGGTASGLGKFVECDTAVHSACDYAKCLQGRKVDSRYL